MDLNAFWGITLSLLVLRAWWKHREVKPRKQKRPVVVVSGDELKAKSEADKQREQDIADLKKQGYTDEIIATILPVINNDK